MSSLHTLRPVQLRTLGALLVGTLLLSVAGGCALVPQSQLTACQAQSRRLNEQSMSQQAEIASLNEHRRSTEDRLIKAETELAAVDKQNKANLQQLANYQEERERLYRRFSSRGGSLPDGVRDQLAELARRFPNLNYDPDTGISKLDDDVLFETGKAELRPDARQMLSQFATILRSPEASGVRLMIVGHTDNERIKGAELRDEYPNNWHLSAGRALAVADYLRASGVPDSRMGVAGYGQYQPVASNAPPNDRQKNRRVEVFLVAPDVAVVGWTETTSTVYR
jgi:chemotaxis protein MotB